MSVSKQVIEEECQQIVNHLDTLMVDRRAIYEEFIHLSDVQKNLVVQLRSDSLSGEGKLHSFQAEKDRIELRLEELEVTLKQKNDLVNELDSKASEYLLSVTTENNSLYDEEEFSEQNDAQKDIINKLVFDEMLAGNEIDGLDTGDYSASDEDRDTSGSGSITAGSITESYDNSKLSHDDTNNTSEAVGLSFQSVNSCEKESIIATELTPLTIDFESEHPTSDQMLSLSSILAELKTVKDEMGKCMTVKDTKSIDIEDQFLSTRQELAFLRETMNKMTDTLRWKESVEYLSQSSDKLSELMLAGSDSSDEDSQNEEESLINDELLGEALQEARHDSDLMYGDKAMDEERVHSGMGRYLYASNRSSSVSSSISAKVAMLECQLKDSGDKLAKANKRISHLLKDRNSKRYECEMLQEKVHKVEAKMCELQGTFDDMAGTIIAERGDLIKNLRENNAYSQILETKLKSFQSNNASQKNQKAEEEINTCKALIHDFETRVNTLKNDNCELSDKLDKLRCKHFNELTNLNTDKENGEAALRTKISELQSSLNSLREDHEAEELKPNEQEIALQKKISELQLEIFTTGEERKVVDSELLAARHSIRDKELDIVEMEQKVSSLQQEINSVSSNLGDEIKRLQQETVQLEEDKVKLQENFSSFQEDSLEIIHKTNESSKTEENITNDSNAESLQQKIDDQTTKNAILTSEIKNKTDAYMEELNAREATIQELQITLTNNQKQSRENYKMLEDDMAALIAQSNKEKEEVNAISTQLKEKYLKLEKDFQQKEEQCMSVRNELECLQITTDLSVENELVVDLKECSTDSSDLSFEKFVCENEKAICSLQEKIYCLERLTKSKNSQLGESKSKNEDGHHQEYAGTQQPPVSRLEAQLLEIKKLNDCLDTIKVELEVSVNNFCSAKENSEIIAGKEESLKEDQASVVEVDVKSELSENQASNNGSLEEKKKLC